jgi:hypothetical protein
LSGAQGEVLSVVAPCEAGFLAGGFGGALEDLLDGVELWVEVVEGDGVGGVDDGC